MIKEKHYVKKCKKCGCVIGQSKDDTKDKVVVLGVCKKCAAKGASK